MFVILVFATVLGFVLLTATLMSLWLGGTVWRNGFVLHYERPKQYVRVVVGMLVTALLMLALSAVST